MVVSIVLLYLGFNFLKGIDFFSSTHKYYAVYQNVDKLAPSNQIYLNGFAVGRVKNITIEQSKNRVIVEMNINSDIIITESSIAMLNGELLGGRFIELFIGKSPVKLNPKDTLDSDVAKSIMDFVANNAEPVASNLQTTIKKLNSVLDNLSQNSQRLDTLFSSLQSTPGLINKTLSTANGNIEGLSTSFKTVTDNMNNRITELKPTLDNFKTLSDSLKLIQLNGTINKAQQALNKLDNALLKFSQGDNTVGKLINEDSLYMNMNHMLLSIDSLANHLNQNPKHFLGPFGKSRKKIERELIEQRKEDAKRK